MKTLTLVNVVKLIGGDKELHFRIEETGEILTHLVVRS
jgi:hypothetical protein